MRAPFGSCCLQFGIQKVTEIMVLASLHVATPRHQALRFSRFLKITAAVFCFLSASNMLPASDFELQLRRCTPATNRPVVHGRSKLDK